MLLVYENIHDDVEIKEIELIINGDFSFRFGLFNFSFVSLNISKKVFFVLTRVLEDATEDAHEEYVSNRLISLDVGDLMTPYGY